MPQAVAFRILLGARRHGSLRTGAAVSRRPPDESRDPRLAVPRRRHDRQSLDVDAWSGRSLINVGRNNVGVPAPTLENGVIVSVEQR